MHSFIEKFREEVSEYCERLETCLLVLESEPGNLSVIGEIFRIMHSMKGSGGMFGFDLISDVTHDLESLFDLFRSEQYAIDSEIISFTLQAVDGIRNLMVQEPAPEHTVLAQRMKQDTQSQISRITQNSAPNTELKGVSESDSKMPDSILSTWYISFEPDEDIFKNGTNPIYLIDELHALGKCNIQIIFDKLPSLSELDPEKCYVSWYLFIATPENFDTLNDVFIFVSDNANIVIEKIAEGNVLHNEQVLASFLNSKINNDSWEIFSQTPIEQAGNTKFPELPVTEPEPSKSEPIEEVSVNSAFAPVTVDSIRVHSSKIDEYMNLVSELITAQSRLDLVNEKLKLPELDLITETFGKLSRQLRENAFDMSLIPLQSVAVRFKRLVHDLSNTLGKEVELYTEGLETELDKNIIEKLTEPLLHIIRNSMDHGIEPKNIRLEKGKPAEGKISIKASTVGSFVQIDIEDDGAGLNVEKLKQKARERGLYSDQKKLTDDEIYQFIFESGFSTTTEVSDLSGRGVGMDVVRRRVQEMRGALELTTEEDRFTRFTIKLPLSLSIIDGLLTTVCGNYYVIPTAMIRNIHTVQPKLLKKDFRQVLEIEGTQIPYLNLREELYSGEPFPEEQLAIVVTFDKHVHALLVDEVVREYQAVIKPLGKLLKNQDVFSGASILGSGQLALVIDTNKMIKQYS